MTLIILNFGLIVKEQLKFLIFLHFLHRFSFYSSYKYPSFLISFFLVTSLESIFSLLLFLPISLSPPLWCNHIVKRHCICIQLAWLFRPHELCYNGQFYFFLFSQKSQILAIATVQNTYILLKLKVFQEIPFRFLPSTFFTFHTRDR